MTDQTSGLSHGASRRSRPSGAGRAGIGCGLWVLLAISGLSLSARAAAPAAPTNCVAAGMSYYVGSTPLSTAQFFIGWNDNSTNETHWKIEVSINNGVFQNLGNTPSSTTTTTGPSGISINAQASTSYRFKVSAFDGAQYSAAATSVAAIAGLFTLTASPVPCTASVDLTWPDAPNETGYRILAKAPSDPGYSILGTVAADVTSVQFSAAWMLPSHTYIFLVQPYLSVSTNILGDSNPSSALVDIPANMTSKPGLAGTPGSQFSHVFTHVSDATVLSRTLTGVPAGLSFNSSSGSLGGVFPAVGVYTLNYAVKFTTGSTLAQTFYIRVRPPAGPPAVGTVIPAWSATVGASRDTALAGTFTDPEAESAVRLSTSAGDMDFILFDTATPATVANFKSYVNAGRYNDVVFHRSLSDFVIQGGGFKGTGSGSQFTRVLKNPPVANPPVANEPGIANARGTVAMAKLPGDPNSATNEFFVSIGDNRGTYPNGLDYQNDGFTVFGRVAGNGMQVADNINNLPTRTYNLFVDGSTTATEFANFPMYATSAPVAMDQTKLMKITSAASIPTLSYSITGNSQPTVASATIVNGQLHLAALAGGQTTVTVTATDLDNLTTSQTVVATISDTYAAWVARNTFPGGQNGSGQNPDGDDWNNLQEYAFLGNPALPTATSLVVYQGSTGTAPSARYPTLTFPVRKSAQGLTYAVEANDGLTGSWSEIWNSTAGIVHPLVVSALVQADRTVVTIRDSAEFGSRPQRFLRIRVVQE